MTAELENAHSWLSKEEMESARSHLPIVYLNILPVRSEPDGSVSEIGLLLAPNSDGNLHHTVISGRVLYHEKIRDAIMRHMEKDLGPVSFPRLPHSITPFGVFEYFPTPDVSGLWDDRQHAIALGYIVPVTGDCQPSQQALDLVWLPVTEINSFFLNSEMSNGQEVVVKSALAIIGFPVQ